MDNQLYREMQHVEHQHWWFRARREILTNLIARSLPQGAILDVGCGTGFVLELLQSQYASQYESWGLDISAIALQFCHDKGLKKVEQGEIDRNTLPANYFDLIMFLDIIEHLDHDLETLKRARQYLKSQGQILITVPAYQFLWSAHDEIHNHKRRYTKSQIGKLLQQAGYEISFISYFNTFLFPLIFLARSMGKLSRRHHASDVSLPSALVNQSLYQIFSWEKNLIPSISFPFGVSILCLARKLEIHD
ncbi:class I SAM-dependent methyltransferase [Pseudanabaena sp. FACHB-1998]|uniref:class I SAM-dependent methyltransferase n=1 Tax=Pseudanabaena sp. FACHB-1998 TaxID=2692858 RepID=UPI00168095A1|nr:class I SAM-dependent methyltransferase [Pseudanabaena sp. FACHB-1998]MBD2178715.1 class I SAM-dependent methyltransferase [Pseudanabaena sp. FACHB-1998]